MPICSVCNTRVEEGSKYVALVEDHEEINAIGRVRFDPGILVRKYKFVHGCEHHEVPNPVIVLGSFGCATKWISEHPLYEAMFLEFLYGAEVN